MTNETNQKPDSSYQITINKILEMLDDIRPYLNMEGGDISFVKYEKGYVYVKLAGACAHCMSQDQTLNDGILLMLQEEIPEIKGIIDVSL